MIGGDRERLQSKSEKKEKRGARHMLFNTNTIGDPRSFFYYNGDFYINGAEIMLTDEYINNHQFNGKKLWKYARYDHQTVYNGRVSYFFCINKIDRSYFNSMGLNKDDYASYFVVEALDIENAIKEVTRPIKLERAETEMIKESIVEPKRDFDNPTLVILWIAYIVVMIGSLIFKQFYIIWAVASFLFFKYRKEMLGG